MDHFIALQQYAHEWNAVGVSNRKGRNQVVHRGLPEATYADFRKVDIVNHKVLKVI